MPSVTHWWQAPEWGRQQAMHFPEPGTRRMRRIGTDVQYDTAQRRWVSSPIRIHIGASFR